MSVFFSRLQHMDELSYYIFSRGFLLASAFLISALAMLLAADAQPFSAWLLLQYAAHLTDMAGVVLATGLFGSALLEQVLHPRGR